MTEEEQELEDKLAELGKFFYENLKPEVVEKLLADDKSIPIEPPVKPVACVHCEHHFISNTTKKDCCIEFGKPFDQIFSESLFTTENFSCNRFESKPSV